jgi:demethylmenaquinone methyltransferase / 2-methoxy-6-polyprenyl-1,4-benzoquinol methylase
LRKCAGVKPDDRIIDVACGTGDLTIKFAEVAYRLSTMKQCAAQVTGIDFTYEMLPIARDKWSRHGIVEHTREDPDTNPGSATFVQFLQGDALALPLPDKSADIVSIAFGIRNVSDWAKAIDEFARVLKPGGRLVILEFSLPTNRLWRWLYNFYFRRVLPRTATWISGDKTGAYKYLPESVNTFISRQAMVEKMRAAGFEGIEARPLTLGVCVCYRGVK